MVSFLSSRPYPLLIRHTELYRTQDQKAQPGRKFKGITTFLFVKCSLFFSFHWSSLFFTGLPLSVLDVTRRPCNQLETPGPQISFIAFHPCLAVLWRMGSPNFSPTHLTYAVKTHLRFSQVTCHKWNAWHPIGPSLVFISQAFLLSCYLPLVKTCVQINKKQIILIYLVSFYCLGISYRYIAQIHLQASPLLPSSLSPVSHHSSISTAWALPFNPRGLLGAVTWVCTGV